MSRTTPLRLAIVDDHPTLLRGLASILSDAGGYQVVATGSSADEAVAVARSARPDVMILDLSMPGDIFAAIDTMTRSSPALKLVIFTAFANVEMALKAIEAGARAFVLKGQPSDDLFMAIEAVRRGELFASPQFSRRLLEGFRNQERRRNVLASQLTAREQQLVDCLLEAQSVPEIARSLDLSERTVGHYLTSLMRKLQVHSRLEIVQAVRSLREERKKL